MRILLALIFLTGCAGMEERRDRNHRFRATIESYGFQDIRLYPEDGGDWCDPDETDRSGFTARAWGDRKPVKGTVCCGPDHCIIGYAYRLR